MINYPRISIITPNFNGATYLETTIKSILDQEYPNLQYIIVDGGSSDDSINIIKKYQDKVAWWISEPDNGLYDALNKGFAQSTGEIMGWLNSDDMLHRNSLYSLAEIFQHEQVNWVQGLHSWFDEKGRTFQVEKVRLRSKYNYLMKDYHSGFSPFIQQESTYWRRSLWEKAGGFISTKYQLAGDFELWMRFFQHGQLYLTNSLIGGFRFTGKGQLSVDNMHLYVTEADNIVEKYQLTSEEKANIELFRRKSWLDFIPYLRRKDYLKRKRLQDEFGSVKWDHLSKSFVIK